jgi:hypothetical protein
MESGFLNMLHKNREIEAVHVRDIPEDAYEEVTE